MATGVRLPGKRGPQDDPGGGLGGVEHVPLPLHPRARARLDTAGLLIINPLPTLGRGGRDPQIVLWMLLLLLMMIPNR